ncbi:MAG: phosphohydrolase [Dysosmobacter sp.]|nr:phosphohydrolase [Dysosmobacter sp.]
MEHSLAPILNAMIAYDAGDPKRIHHFLKVHAFARLIGLGEGLDPDTQFILEIASVVHDIGIHRAEALYGSSGGKYQEALGPAEAEALLTPLGLSRQVIERVMYLVGHHHTYTDIEGMDYQILVEADFLVNLYEDNEPPAARKRAYEAIFRTATGKQLCRQLYPEVLD